MCQLISMLLYLFLTPFFNWHLKGRVDDNLETILKQLDVYFESTLPVINYYIGKGKVQEVIVTKISDYKQSS